VTEFIFLDVPVDYVWQLRVARPARFDYLELPIQTLKVGSLGTHKALGLAKNKKRPVPARLDLGDLRRPAGASADRGILGQPFQFHRPAGCYDEAKRFAEALGDGLPPGSIGVEKPPHRAHLQHLRPRMRFERRAGGTGLRQPGAQAPARHRLWPGRQTRSFCYVSDLIEGIYRLMMSSYDLPVNIGNPAEMTCWEFAKQIIPRHRLAQQDLLQTLPQDESPPAPSRHHPGQENPGLDASPAVRRPGQDHRIFPAKA